MGFTGHKFFEVGVISPTSIAILENPLKPGQAFGILNVRCSLNAERHKGHDEIMNLLYG
jgi:hypothetical protein